MNDNDLIRRGDAGDIALEADLGWHDGISGDWHPFSAKDICNHIAAAIRALPAHVQPAPVAVAVKPLQWFEVELPSRGGGKHTADGYTIRKIEGLWLLDFAGEGKSKWRWVELEAAKAAAQADHSARILSALDARPVARVQASLEDALNALADGPRLIGDDELMAMEDDDEA